MRAKRDTHTYYKHMKFVSRISVHTYAASFLLKKKKSHKQSHAFSFGEGKKHIYINLMILVSVFFCRIESGIPLKKVNLKLMSTLRTQPNHEMHQIQRFH